MTAPQPDGLGDEQAPLDDVADPLHPLARALALVLGSGAGGAGGYAVFVSDNQAGTAILIVASVVLLLLGLQGTPLRSLGGGEYRIDLARLRRRAAQVIDQAARQESPEVATAVADAVGALDPGIALSRPPWMLYEHAVRQAIRRTGGVVDLTHRNEASDRGVDAQVQLPSGTVTVQVKYRTRGSLGLRDIAVATAQLRSSGLSGGHLLITNAPLSAEAREHNAGKAPDSDAVEVVTWNDERDDGLLARALARNAQ